MVRRARMNKFIKTTYYRVITGNLADIVSATPSDAYFTLKNSRRNIETRATVAHKSRPAKRKIDMNYIIRPRGDGTAYQFMIRTPAALRGMTDPATGRTFGRYIKRSLGATRHLPTARKLRDIRLAEVRTMEAEARGPVARVEREEPAVAAGFLDVRPRSGRTLYLRLTNVQSPDCLRRSAWSAHAQRSVCVTNGPWTKPLALHWRPWSAFRTDRHPLHLGMWASA
jgi:hypothetical protein